MMTNKAYLVGHLDTRTTPPTLFHVGMYSTNAQGLTGIPNKEFIFDIIFADGDSFQEALDSLMSLVKENLWLHWILPYMSKYEREKIESLHKISG